MANEFLASLGGLVLAMLSCQATEPALQRFTYVEKHMGTRFKIILYAPDEETANRAAKAAWERVTFLDDTMTDYRSTSELMRLCAKAGGEPVPVSDDLFRVLAKSQEISKLSDGAFDVTVGPLVKLWREARRKHQLPDPKQLAAARELVGWRNVRLDPAKHTVQLLKPGMQLDLGGIGKGFASDEAIKLLKQHGITRALVAAGGDIAVSDPPPGTEGWTIGIAPLLDPDEKPTRYLLLKNAGVSTSGDAEQYVEIGGKRYSHIVDPKTGIGLVGRMSVTVVGPNDTTADGLTKLVAVLGPEKGMKVLDSLDGVAALMVRKTDTGEEVFTSSRWKKLTQRNEEKK